MNFEEFQNQSRFYVVGALEPGGVGEALPPCGSLNSPACSCVSIMLPALVLQDRIKVWAKFSAVIHETLVLFFLGFLIAPW